MNLSPRQAEFRLKRDIRACKTIAITIATNFFAHVPAILFAVVDSEEGSMAEVWFGFFAIYSLYLSSAMNPIIYYLRNSRLQSALRQFLKDPLGSSDFRENSAVKINARPRHNDDVMVRTEHERVGNTYAIELDLLEGQTRRNISYDQEGAEIVLSIITMSIEAWTQTNGNDTERGGCRMPRPEVPSTLTACWEEQVENDGKQGNLDKERGTKDSNRRKRAIFSCVSSRETKVHPQDERLCTIMA